MNQEMQMTQLLISNILSLAAVILMFFALKSGFEQKTKLLKLFQLGYFGMLILGLFSRLLAFAELQAGVHDAHKWMVIRYGGDSLNLMILVPYLIYSFGKSKQALV